MAINEVEAMKQHLIDLNLGIGEMEQEQGKEALKFFHPHFSENLVFRRTSGKIVGKGVQADRPCFALLRVIAA